jgi:hypothetical protein
MVYFFKLLFLFFRFSSSGESADAEVDFIFLDWQHFGLSFVKWGVDAEEFGLFSKLKGGHRQV